MRVPSRAVSPLVLFAAALGALSACGLAACGAEQGGRPPSIEFVTVPEAGGGGPLRLEKIEGRVTGARPGQKIVLYARSGGWWVQPLANEPFTAIEGDATWHNSTH